MATTPVSLPQAPTLRRPALPTVRAVDTRHLAIITVITVVLLGLASLVYLNLAATVANSSTRLQEITKARRELEWQRTAKEQELAQVTSPDRLEARAQELGFRPATSVTYIKVSPALAAELDIKSHTSASAPTPAPPPTGLDVVRAQFQQWLGR